MIRNSIAIIIILFITYFIAQWLINAPVEVSHDPHAAPGDEAEDFPRGPHGGRLLTNGDLALEITIYETGIPSEFHIYPYTSGNSINPANVDVKVTLQRTGNVNDVFEFSPQQDYLRGGGMVTEPHSFDVIVAAQYKGNNYTWSYENYEGRTEIPHALATEAGIATETAGPVILVETLTLNGRVQIDPNRLSHVRPRFPGKVQAVHKRLGDTVRKGQVLVTVQSNESLQAYDVTAPIHGLITQRRVQVGESSGDDPLFTITDLSEVWVELDIFAADLPHVKAGLPVIVETLEGIDLSGVINWISPLTAHASQSVQAIVYMDNRDNHLRPGQFIRGHITLAEHDVELAVKQSAIQGFRDFQVVYARFDDTYEVRMLELGRRNDEWVEVLSGLEPDTEYVTENSYLIKADIEKAGASHDH